MVMSKACMETAKRLAQVSPENTLSRDAEALALADAIGEIGKRKTIADYGLEAVINGYLSGTMTPIANALSISVRISCVLPCTQLVR
jgi:hypothetical protein